MGLQYLGENLGYGKDYNEEDMTNADMYPLEKPGYWKGYNL